MDTHHDLPPLNRNTWFLSRTLPLLPLLTVWQPQPDGGTDGDWGRRRNLACWNILHMLKLFYQLSICFLHIEQTFVCICIPVASVCVGLRVGSPRTCAVLLMRVCVPAFLHTIQQPISIASLYRDFLSAYLLFNSRIIIKWVLSAFWEPGEYITDVQSGQITHGISGLNMWTIYQVHHLSFLSFSNFLSDCIQTFSLHFSFPPTFFS